MQRESRNDSASESGRADGSVASVLQAWLTPVLVVATAVLGWATWRIQQQQARSAALQADSAKAQAESAKVQAETNRQQHRLALFDRRLKVFDATMKLIVEIMRDARVEYPQLFALMRETREHEFLFGPEIGEFINTVYRNGVELHTRAAAIPHGQQGDIQRQTELLQWFAEQTRAGTQLFQRYLDFRGAVGVNWRGSWRMKVLARKRHLMNGS